MALLFLSNFLFFLTTTILYSTTTASRILSDDMAKQPSTVAHKYGPIMTNGRPYNYVCDDDRFVDLGLDMAKFAYCEKNLSYYDRVSDLIGRMSLSEKVNQLSNYGKGVERIGLPKYNWWSEILHGVSDVGEWPTGSVGHATWFGEDVKGATQFPSVINSAASFNESLWRAIAEIVSTEGRAMHNLGHTGLTFWSPVINLVRDPRWGRIMETPGEDPIVVGTYAVNFVRGLQDIKGFEVTQDLNTRPLKVGSCCKHFGAYDVEDWFGTDRFHFDARVSEQDMVESFSLPFEMCVKEGDTVSVMCSYNKVNGIPACANRKLLSQKFRGEWDLHGYIVSDCDAIEFIAERSYFLNASSEDAIALTIDAGMDLECGTFYKKHALSAVEKGRVRETDLDKSLKNLYLVLMRLGFFDGMPLFQSLGLNDICTEANTEMAAEAARQGMVLLKNNNNALPLDKKTHNKLAIGGPHVHSLDAVLANYHGTPCHQTSPLKAFTAEAEKVVSVECFDAGKPDMYCSNQTAREQMKEAAKQADTTILFMGINLDIEREFHDRDNLTLPENQIKWITQVSALSKTPIILVILSAGGLDISFARDDPKIGAILWAGYPGQEAGRAIADVVYGRYNPGGRLPITWYKNDYTKMLPMTSMPFRPIPELGYPGRTYKFYDGPTVFPFGYGLSYTNFEYKLKSPPPNKLHVKLGKYQQCLALTYKQQQQQQKNSTVPVCPSVRTEELACKDEIQFQVVVKNTGKLDGNDVVMVYSKPPAEVEGAPIKQLAAFQRVFVPAGQSKTLKFSINACRALNLVEKTAYRVLPSGNHTIMVGGNDCSPSFPLQVMLS